MPNWNYNSVTIGAPINEVKKYLVFPKGEKYAMFNMHRLYPEVFSEKDKAWYESYEFNWAIEHTGTKWFPHIEYVGSIEGDMTVLAYDTAREPNNNLLEKLHEITGWYILNEYEEPGMSFEGLFVCQEDHCIDHRGIYHPSCEVCEKKQHPDLIDYDAEDFLVCKICLAAKS